jgi:hypothetical protein
MTPEKRDRIAELVGDVLNIIHYMLPPMRDEDFNEFVDIVESNAREWAEACYEVPDERGL